MKKAVLILGAAASLLVAGCMNSIEPKSTESVGQDATVARLFEIDGCRVYRFMDAGRYRYFANCGQITTTSSSYTQMVGKTATSQAEEISAFNPKAKYEK